MLVCSGPVYQKLWPWVPKAPALGPKSSGPRLRGAISECLPPKIRQNHVVPDSIKVPFQISLMSNHEISDIGNGIIQFQCFFTTDMFLFCKSIIFSGDCSKSLPPLQSSVKTRFKAFWDIFSKICMRPRIRSLRNIRPKRPLRVD